MIKKLTLFLFLTFYSSLTLYGANKTEERPGEEQPSIRLYKTEFYFELKSSGLVDVYGSDQMKSIVTLILTDQELNISFYNAPFFSEENETVKSSLHNYTLKLKALAEQGHYEIEEIENVSKLSMYNPKLEAFFLFHFSVGQKLIITEQTTEESSYLLVSSPDASEPSLFFENNPRYFTLYKSL